MHHETVKSILREDLKMRKVNFKWVPHMLNSSHKASLVEVSRELLDSLESAKIALGAKHRPGMKPGCIGADVARPTRVRRTVPSKRRICGVDFARRGIAYPSILDPRFLSLNNCTGVRALEFSSLRQIDCAEFRTSLKGGCWTIRAVCP
jgi:hypothetical protein